MKFLIAHLLLNFLPALAPVALTATAKFNSQLASFLPFLLQN